MSHDDRLRDDGRGLAPSKKDTALVVTRLDVAAHPQLGTRGGL